MMNHVWQSTVFALAAGLLTVAFRRNKAQVRYWLWLSASVKFLLPFALLMSLGSLMPQAKTVVARPPAIATTVVEIAQPFSDRLPAASSSPRAADWEPVVLLCAWLSGFFGVAMIRLRGWLRIRAAVRSSSRVAMRLPVEVRSSPGLLEPGVVGFLRPILLLPAGIEERLTTAQLQAVLAHELAHVRRRDNVTSAIHMLVEAIFWFHPLVWWIGARLVEERERACDEAVLSLGSEPRDYAEGILNVCKLYVESPLVCVPGVTGANLKRRIESIMQNRKLPILSPRKKAVLAMAAAAAIVASVAVGVLIAQTQEPAPKWEVTAVRRCEDAPDGTRGGGGNASPGRLHINCQSVKGLVLNAYVRWASGRRDMSPAATGTPIDGGPAWINTERYEIDAKAETEAGEGMMQGRMMQALLEDRFKLRLRRGTREIPVYDLTVAKGGLKLPRAEKQTCPPSVQSSCFSVRSDMPRVDIRDMSMDEFSRIILTLAVKDRPVIDKTGVTGLFDFRLQFAPDDTVDDPNGFASIFTAVQEQLGLKLESAKGPGPYLVIDSIQHPSDN